MRTTPELVRFLAPLMCVGCTSVTPRPPIAVPRPTPEPSAAEPTLPPASTASPGASPASPVLHAEADDADSSSPAEPPPEPETAPLDLAVVADAPYKLYQRPRATGPVLAAGEDETLARWNLGGTGDAEFISNRPGYHPGARVVVDTQLVGGSLPERSRQGLSQRGVLAQSRSHGYWPMRICYEDALRRNSKLKGATHLRVSIGSSGAVTRVRLRDTELDEEAGRCLTLVTENLKYTPGPPRVVAIDLSVRFWPGDAPVPSDGPPPGTLLENPGHLDNDAVSATFEAALDPIKACYATGLARDPGLWGRLELEIRQNDSGDVEDVREAESRFPDRSVTDCVLRVVRELRLPSPTGGTLSFIQGLRFGAPPTRGSEASEPAASP